VAGALHHLSGKDVLALARARDRLLARLFQQGLSAEADLPAFFRFSGASNARFQVFCDWLQNLPTRVRHWLANVNPTGNLTASDTTLAYADLILAFGFARLGEKDTAVALRQRANDVLASRDDVHSILQAAYSYRIDQALNGLAPAGALPWENCLEHVQGMEVRQRYKVDRLRQYSAILEPDEQIDPYREFHKRIGTDLSKHLKHLADIYDPEELQQRLTGLLQRFGTGKGEGKANRALIVKESIEWTPRVGEAFAQGMLAEVSDACGQFKDVKDQAILVGKALFVAAHFNQMGFVKEFLARLQILLRPESFHKLVLAEPTYSHHSIVDTLLRQCFRGLRKLGMRDVIEGLLTQLTTAVLQGKPFSAYREREDAAWLGLLRALLQVAGGWFYFGMNDRAMPILKEARQYLFQADADRSETRAEIRKVARVYIDCLGQAPAELALRGIDELFSRLRGIRDNFDTNSHYGLWQLEMVEAVVLAIVTEDFARGNQARRWLDDDEYLIRKRIHADMQEAMG
jgi:hypothetical protein